MSKSRNNHYVPEWYQKGFLLTEGASLRRLDFTPDVETLPDGRQFTHNRLKWRPPSKCFCEYDLYTTIFGEIINVEVETKLFGQVDNSGVRAVAAFTRDDVSEWHERFQDFFSYIDIQKIRTPKGLEWIKSHFPQLSQVELMEEMQAITNMNCVIWTEGVREIVSAEQSDTKFIISDHPVTIYNYALDPDDELCRYPNDPSILLKGSQTIFPLDKNRCLILTNYQYAKSPDAENPIEKRIYANRFRTSYVRTDAFIKTRTLTEDDVRRINYIIKKRAKRYIAAAKEDWLFPERYIQSNWSDFKELLLPPKNELFHFGGELYAGFDGGGTHYQDAYGRTQPENPYLKKPVREKPPKPGELCGCGSGLKYKKCCMDKPPAERPTWTELSIRERNLYFLTGIEKILGLSQGKTWTDVRKELSDKQVKEIHELVGFFWPLATDLYSLLPKPDNQFRALYTGIIDPRTTIEIVKGLAPYFDEIIIQTPFMNPWRVRPEYSPVENPQKHKVQTLSNVLLFLELAPFIQAGFVNVIPDPCSFDAHMWSQMLAMARDRTAELLINEKDKKLLKALNEDSARRTLSMMPVEFHCQQVRKTFPDYTEKQMADFLSYTELQRQNDPLTLLQENVFSNVGGSEQFLQSTMSPNFEMSLMIAQITGAFLLTDIHYRWNEMSLAQQRFSGRLVYQWSALTKEMAARPVILNFNPQACFDLRHSAQFNEFRAVLRDIYQNIKEVLNPKPGLIESLRQQYIRAYDRAHALAKKTSGEKVSLSLDFLAPAGGIVHNNVQRILITSGADVFRHNVPMSVLIHRPDAE